MSRVFSQSEYLTILTHSPAEPLKAFAETILAHLGHITVLVSRTGLVMLPFIDSAQGTTFHLGEVLTAEAHICLETGVEGYGMVSGRDLEQAMAVAVLDAAVTAGIQRDEIFAFVAQQAAVQAAADAELLRQVEATRVEMETF